MNWWVLSTIALGGYVVMDLVFKIRTMHRLGATFYAEAMRDLARNLQPPPSLGTPPPPPKKVPQCSCSCHGCSPVHGGGS